jgi:hypothetical protein
VRLSATATLCRNVPLVPAHHRQSTAAAAAAAAAAPCGARPAAHWAAEAGHAGPRLGHCRAGGKPESSHSQAVMTASRRDARRTTRWGSGEVGFHPMHLLQWQFEGLGLVVFGTPASTEQL